MDIYSRLSREELKAHEHFLARTVFPLCYDKVLGVSIEGTGCFYRSEDRVFVITAAHVLDSISAKDLGIPIAPVADVRIRKFMNVKVHPSQDASIDIVAIEVLDSLFLREVFQNWFPVTIADVDVSEDSLASEYLIAGYPYMNVVAEDDKLIPKSLFQLYTNRYSGPVDNGQDESDFFMKHTYKAKNAEAHIIEVVDMQGVSGAPVWKLQLQAKGVWAPMKSLKLAGVQGAVKANSYIRAKKWSYVDKIISGL